MPVRGSVGRIGEPPGECACPSACRITDPAYNACPGAGSRAATKCRDARVVGRLHHAPGAATSVAGRSELAHGQLPHAPGTKRKPPPGGLGPGIRMESQRDSVPQPGVAAARRYPGKNAPPHPPNPNGVVSRRGVTAVIGRWQDGHSPGHNPVGVDAIGAVFSLR